jgi:hypothetical protein
MLSIVSSTKHATLVFYGFKFKTSDIRCSLSKLTDLSGALHSFSIRTIKNERPRNKFIIDVELAKGFDPLKYNDRCYLYEFIAQMKKLQRSFREFIRVIPTTYFPELYFHSYEHVEFDFSRYSIKSTYYF